MKQTKIKFYSSLIFPGTDNVFDMLRSVNIVVGAVNTVCQVFNGKAVYDGDGSEVVQYDDVVVFDQLSDIHKEAILSNYPYSREIL